MKKKKNVEIQSFNEELVSFDMPYMGVEDLERRFEMALSAVFGGDPCGELSCAEVSCSVLTCGVFKVE